MWQVQVELCPVAGGWADADAISIVPLSQACRDHRCVPEETFKNLVSVEPRFSGVSGKSWDFCAPVSC